MLQFSSIIFIIISKRPEIQIFVDNILWKLDCKLRGMTDESIRRYKSSLKIFIQFLNNKDLNVNNVDFYALRDFLQYVLYERKNKRKTVENYFSALSAFYDYLTFEGVVNSNVILPFRKRYLRRYKNGFDDPERKLLSIEEMSRLVNSIMDPRDKAIAVLLAKTGIRRGGLLRLDVDDISWEEYSITLKPTPKRSNRTVFFDDECAVALRRWLRVRGKLNPPTNALFISYQSLNRLDRNGLYTAITKYARRLGFHNPNSPRLEDHFGPHCFRHWFTTWLLRNGMPREYVKELRGDKRKEAIDIYHHIDKQELRKAYLACIPPPSLPWLISALTIIGVALHEENIMIKKHGEKYTKYQESTHFLVPLPKRISDLIVFPLKMLLKKRLPESRKEIASTILFYGAALVALSIPLTLLFPI